MFLPLSGLRLRSEAALADDFSVASGDGFLAILSLLLVDSDWKEVDKLRIEGHSPSRPPMDTRDKFLVSARESRTGVVDLGEAEGVEDLEDGDDAGSREDGDGCLDVGVEVLVEGVEEGLFLSTDWERFCASAGDVRPELGDKVCLTVAVAIAVTGTGATAGLYLDAMSLVRTLPLACTTLLFSDVTRGGRELTLTGEGFRCDRAKGGSILCTSIIEINPQ